MFKTDLAAEFDANGRRRRPPPDPINAALSFAYSMLTHECTAALRTASLEPSIGALHVSRPGRPALALDLMEPFRPLIADSVVVTAFNRSEPQGRSFGRGPQSVFGNMADDFVAEMPPSVKVAPGTLAWPQAIPLPGVATRRDQLMHRIGHVPNGVLANGSLTYGAIGSCECGRRPGCRPTDRLTRLLVRLDSGFLISGETTMGPFCRLATGPRAYRSVAGWCQDR